MDIWSSNTYRADLQSAALVLDTEKLRGKRVLVTGATGLICSAILDLLIYSNRENNTDIAIYAAGRSIERIEERFPHGKDYGLIPIGYDATRAVDFDFAVDYIIHGASNASPDKYMSEPVDTLTANVFGVANLLEYAIKTKAEKVVYVSSSEVYGKLAHGRPLVEDEYGDVDVLAVRSAYPMGKRAAETLCVGYMSQYGVDVSIVRPGHIYGPTAQVTDNRVSSAFVRQAVRGENIVMKSAGMQLRSYCHCLDCATAILTVLTRGQRGLAYNISNKDAVITIRQMSAIVARCAGVELLMDLPADAERAAFNPMGNSSLNSQRLESLGWKGLFDADTGFEHTIRVLKEIG